MNLPYPTPTWVKTKRRCMFRMPGRAYNCRAIGAYVLNGRCYCAAHYDTAWKVANPIYGQQHDWQWEKTFKKGDDMHECCALCGIGRPYDGLPLNPCDGKMPRIVLW